MQRLAPRLRYGMIISLEEYNRSNIYMVRNFQAEAMTEGYLGWACVMDEKARLFVYTSRTSAEKAVRIARNIGFESAGMVEGEIFISNSELSRPHLSNIRQKNYFYREYYR